MVHKNLFLIINGWYATSQYTTSHTDIHALCSSTRDLFSNRTFVSNRTILFHMMITGGRKEILWCVCNCTHYVNTYIPAGQEFLFCTNTIKSHISCLQFYATNNWKDFPKTSSWRRTSWPLFGLHTYIFLLLDTRGHIRRDNRLTGLRVSQYRGWEEYTWKPFLHLTTHGSDYEPHKYSPLNPNYPQFSLKLHPKMPMAVLRTSYIIYGAQWKWKWESSSWKVFRISVTAGHWTI